MLSPHPPQIHSSEKNTSRFWLLREIHLWDQIFIKFWDHSASLDCCIDIDIFMRFWSDDIIIRFPSNSYFWDHPASLHCCSHNLQVDHLGSHDSRWFFCYHFLFISCLLFVIICSGVRSIKHGKLIISTTTHSDLFCYFYLLSFIIYHCWLNK